MRYNAFNEAYCHTLNDMIEIIEKKGLVPDLDLHAEISADEDAPGTWGAEVRFNEDGDPAFYVEGYKSKYDLTADLQQIGIPNTSINEL